MKSLWDERYQPADAEIVKRKATNITCKRGNHRLEADDVAQDLAMHVFEKTPQHDPNRGSREKFVKKIVKNKALNLIEHRHAQKRDDRKDISYDESLNTRNDGSGIGNQTDLQIEMQALAKKMPPDVREVFEKRLGGSTEADLVNELHMSRQRIRTLLQQMERQFRQAKLDKYLTEQPIRERNR